MLQLLHVAFLADENLPDVIVSGEDAGDVAFAGRQWFGGKVSIGAGAYHEIACREACYLAAYAVGCIHEVFIYCNAAHIVEVCLGNRNTVNFGF